jgi:hypothetical protein
MGVFRTLYRWLVALFALGVVAQFFLAGLGAFRAQRATTGHGTLGDKAFGHDFNPHAALGFLLLLVGLLVFLAALAGRLGRTQVLLALALPLLIVLQSVFAHVGPSGFRALHVVNGLAILGISGRLAHAAWRPRDAVAV